MSPQDRHHELRQALDGVLGFLNFSSGAEDAAALRHWDLLFSAQAAPERPPGESPVAAVQRMLQERLQALQSQSGPFQRADQATRALSVMFDRLIPAYERFHRLSLEYLPGDEVWTGFFVGRVAEATLAAIHLHDRDEEAARTALRSLNDFVGHRPVPVLENRRHTPYPHEFIRPSPLFIQGVGVASGSYRVVVERALEMLNETDDDLLRAAYFSLEQLRELAFDPRAYDFEHPANKRPNYHFGQWDPHRLDRDGRYERFVLQKVTLDALMARVPQGERRSKRRDRLTTEAAAVLSGVILMSSAVSGDRPEAHGSNVTLGNLLPGVAALRDAFYERLLARMPEDHREKLLTEAGRRKQPFGAARQELNAELSRRRAHQLTRVHLARLYSRMGYGKAAQAQIAAVQTVSAKMHCRIDRLLWQCQRLIDRRELDQACDLVADVIEQLHMGIDCGAFADPWSLLGFQGQYSLFPALENSTFDHRVDELLDLVQRVFGIMARLWSEAAAVDHPTLFESLDLQFGDFASWWRQFAAHEVESLDCEDAQEVYHAAKLVAEAMRLWHRGGAEAGNVAFWKPHVAMFDSPKAFGLVIRALLGRGDLVASMALMLSWVGQAERIALESAEASFSDLAEEWMARLRNQDGDDGDARYLLAEKFLHSVEANAESFWRPPSDWRESIGEPVSPTLDPDWEDDESDPVTSAAYEEVVYVDSTADGVDSETLEGGAGPATGGLAEAAPLLNSRLDFLNCVSRLFRIVALWPRSADDAATARGESLQYWFGEAANHRRSLLALMASVAREPLQPSRGDQQSLLEYDRQRLTKDGLLEVIIAAYCEASFAAMLLAAAAGLTNEEELPETDDQEEGSADQRAAVSLLAAILRRDPDASRSRYSQWREALQGQPLLYVPLARGGSPRRIAETRVRQGVIKDLLKWLPRAGLLTETCELIETARQMEMDHYVGEGAVTEFDELFTAGFRSLVDAIAQFSDNWREQDFAVGEAAGGSAPEIPDEPAGNIFGAFTCRTATPDELTALAKSFDLSEEQAPQLAAAQRLAACLETLIESVLMSWLTHSRTLRLSVLERVQDAKSWKELREFIQRYGGDIFSQQFLNLGNIRAILHQTVDKWLRQVRDYSDDATAAALLADIDAGAIDYDRACALLSLILEAVIENYGEYRDYNGTTTQSDRGDQLYTLIDFLRLRARYDRACWRLRPVNLVHEALARGDRALAASLWRRAITERIEPEADGYQRELRRLQKKYSIGLHTVADRVNERFVRPLKMDRLRALAAPAIRQATDESSSPAFELLQAEASALADEPAGAGLDTPVWLAALEDEVERCMDPSHRETPLALLPELHIQLTLAEVCGQLEAWMDRHGRLR